MRSLFDSRGPATIRLPGRRAAERRRHLRGAQPPSAIYPELAFPRVLIVAEGSSLGARQMLFSVTRPIEEAVSIVPGVTRVRSRTIRGGARSASLSADNTDMMYALQQAQARVIRCGRRCRTSSTSRWSA